MNVSPMDAHDNAFFEDFAEAFSKELEAILIQKSTSYQHPNVKPQVMQGKRGVMIKLVKEMEK